MPGKGMQKEMKPIPVPCYWNAKVITEGLQNISAEEDKQKRQWVYSLTNILWLLSKTSPEEIYIRVWKKECNKHITSLFNVVKEPQPKIYLKAPS